MPRTARPPDSTSPGRRAARPAAQPAGQHPPPSAICQPSPGGPCRKAQHRRADGDRHGAEQPGDDRGPHGERAQHDPRRPGPAPVAQPPEAAAAERQRQAAGDGDGERPQRRQQLPGVRERGRRRPEPQRRLGSHPGRQPEKRQRPEPVPHDPSPDIHGAASHRTRRPYKQLGNPRIPEGRRADRGAKSLSERERRDRGDLA